MADAYICDAVRTPIGRYGGALSMIRTDDLGAVPLEELMRRNPSVDWSKVEDVWFGCANQAGEDNRNVARMSSLLAGLPVTVPATTLNRLCGSGMDAVGSAARAIKSGEIEFAIAGGVESMSRAPFVTAKSTHAFSREAQLFDTTIGWRFVNERMDEKFGVDSMPQTAENVAQYYSISREEQDAFALSSQKKTAAAQLAGYFEDEIVPVSVPGRNGESVVVTEDEHPRGDTTAAKLSRLGTPFRKNGTVTAGNASGVNDGACALLLASDSAAQYHGLTPRARVVSMATSALEPRIMGFGPFEACKKVLEKAALSLAEIDVIEINEAFAAQALAVSRALGLADGDERINPNGGAIALGHPLGMSGARLVTTAMYQLQRSHGHYALCTMCVGVGQGIALIIERIKD